MAHNHRNCLLQSLTLLFAISLICTFLSSTCHAISKDECESAISEWEDTPTATQFWTVISMGDTKILSKMLDENPCNIFLRSKDGRGPLFWAYEFGRTDIVQFLLSKGADPNAKDKDGKMPKEMKRSKPPQQEPPAQPPVPPSQQIPQQQVESNYAEELERQMALRRENERREAQRLREEEERREKERQEREEEEALRLAREKMNALRKQTVDERDEL